MTDQYTDEEQLDWEEWCGENQRRALTKDEQRLLNGLDGVTCTYQTATKGELMADGIGRSDFLLEGPGGVMQVGSLVEVRDFFNAN